MGITSIIALLIFSSGITGAIMTVLWLVFCGLGKKYLNSNIIYTASRIVIVSYYIPSMFIIMMFQDKIMDIEDTSFLFFTQIIKVILTVFFGVAFVLFIREINKVIIRYKKLNNICGSRIPAEIDINNFKKTISDRLKIKRDVKLYIGYSVPCPFTYGIIRPTIYLPPEKIDEIHLQVLLTHELFHNKQRDFIWKPLSTITRCIHWANPFIWIAAKNIERWAEASCDYKCCTKGSIDTDAYFMYLKKTLDSLTELSRKYILGLEGDENEFLWRKERMRANKSLENRNVLVASLSICAVLGGCLSIYGVTEVMNKAYFGAFINTAKVAYEDIQIDEYAEDTMLLNELEEQGVIFEKMEMNISSDRAGSVEGIMDIGIFGISQDIYLTKSDFLRIIFTIDPKNADINIGILQPDGVIRYISCSEYLMYDFNITQTGMYKIYVYNNSDEVVNVFISYAY